MIRSKSLLAVAAPLALLTILVSVAQAQQRGRRMMGRSSFMALLSREQVQKEMNLSEEQKTKVQAVTQKLMEEAREEFAALREIEDRSKMMAKMNELSDKLDTKLREQMRDLGLEREQLRRLFQIRLQVNAVADSLSNERLAGRLELTDEQKKKLADINKDMQAKMTELFGKMSSAEQDQRGAVFQELRQLRTDTEKQALGVLTAEQKKSFEEMKGKIIELRNQRQRGSI
jgi:Spy/CpxP family protein refolding chaperone